VEVVANLVDGALFGLGQVARLVEGIWATLAERSRYSQSRIRTLFKEETHFVSRLEEVRVANVVCTVITASRELGHWVVLELELVQHLVGISQ
jgi:hypothetical protein